MKNRTYKKLCKKNNGSSEYPGNTRSHPVHRGAIPALYKLIHAFRYPTGLEVYPSLGLIVWRGYYSPVLILLLRWDDLLGASRAAVAY